MAFTQFRDFNPGAPLYATRQMRVRGVDYASGEVVPVAALSPDTARTLHAHNQLTHDKPAADRRKPKAPVAVPPNDSMPEHSPPVGAAQPVTVEVVTEKPSDDLFGDDKPTTPPVPPVRPAKSGRRW